VNLGLFFFEKPHQFIVLLDGLERLHVDRLAGRTCPVHDAGDAPLQFRANGNDEALAANGDQVFLSRAFRGELAKSGAE
jgi:hypothetical protein